MTTLDGTALGWVVFLIACGVVTIISCLTYLCVKIIDGRVTIHEAQRGQAQHQAQAAEARARQAEAEYQRALVERVGDPIALPPVSINIPQDKLDAMALEYLTHKVHAMRVNVQAHID